VGLTELPPLKVEAAPNGEEPNWRIPIETFCPGPKYPKKSHVTGMLLKQLFKAHLRCDHPDAFYLYTDGSKTDGAVGSAVVSEEGTLMQRLLPETSIYSAELIAIQMALHVVEERDAPSVYVIYSDSKAALQGLRNYNSRHPIIAEITATLVRIARSPKQVSMCWVPGHAEINGNDRADEAARTAAASNVAPRNTGVPCRDYYPIIKASILNLWQQQWNNVQENKLKKIKPNVRAWPFSACRSRRAEVLLCRWRIGHTRLTHRYL
jgi:ribonuclease HI